MARPIESALPYFSLDCNFFSHRKVTALRRTHGAVGILAYINILCRIYGTNGYYYKFDDLDELCHDIAEDIAQDSLAKVTARVRESINYMAAIGMLDCGYLAIGVLTSNSVQEQYSFVVKKFKRKKNITEYALNSVGVAVSQKTVNSEEMAVNSEETPINSEETLRKGKGKRKGNNTLSNERVYKPPTLEEIELYCRERNNDISPQRFYDYYLATNWTIHGEPIKDWRAVVRRWETNGYNDNKKQAQYTQERYDDNELDDLFTKFE